MVGGLGEPAVTAAGPRGAGAGVGRVGWDLGLCGPESSQAHVACDTRFLFIKCLPEAGKGPFGGLCVGFTFPVEVQRSLAMDEVHTVDLGLKSALSDSRAHVLSTGPSWGPSASCQSRLGLGVTRLCSCPGSKGSTWAPRFNGEKSPLGGLLETLNVNNIRPLTRTPFGAPATPECSHGSHRDPSRGLSY